MSYSREEILAAFANFGKLHERAAKGDPGEGIYDVYTEDATFDDPDWGHYEGVEAIRAFLSKSMIGLEDWEFPFEWLTIDEDRVILHWLNRLPGRRADGSYYEAPGVTILTYAGDGKFSKEVDIVNMVHVAELIEESGWQAPAHYIEPPRKKQRR